MGKKLLLVEDEEFISYIYKRQFELSGYSVDTAPEGLSGLKALQNNKYDLILLDIMMPGMNGIDVLKKVKEDVLTKEIPVIMVTNLAQDDIMAQAFKLGAAAYWIKANNSPQEIVKQIDKFFEEKEKAAISA